MGLTGTRKLSERHSSRSTAIVAAVIIAFALLFGICPGQALAAEVTLAWDRNTEPAVSGYRLYYGTSSRTYGTPTDVPGVNTTTHTVNGLEDGQGYFFAVTAYDTFGNESGYSNEVAYTPGPGATPEINLVGNSVNIADGDASPSTVDFTDFGSADIAGGTVTRTFMVQNTGTGTLTLSGSPRVALGGTNAADFTVSVPPAAIVAVSGSTTFQVRFDPSATGTRGATLSIANNDANENPYTFSIQGTGTTITVPGGPEINLVGNAASIPNRDTTPSIEDFTDFGSAYIKGGAVWRTFTIENTGTSVLKLRRKRNARVKVGGANAGNFKVTVQPPASIAAQGSAAFQVRFLPSATGTRSAKLIIASNDNDERRYNFAIRGTGTGTGTAPEISVAGNAVNIVDGDTAPGAADHTDFGAADVVSGSVIRTFSLRNTGTGDLILSGTPRVAVSGANAADFTVTTQPPANIGAAGSTIFQVRFNPSVAGRRLATLTIANNDANESPFNFAIRGTGTTTPVADERPAADAATAETITKPAAPSGPTILSAGVAYSFSTHGAISSIGDAVQYRFSWSDGTASEWLPVGVVAARKTWTVAGTYAKMQVQARCANHPSVVSTVSAPLTVTVGAAAVETISLPATPVGAPSLPAMTTSVYKVGGAVSSSGDAVQYRLHWSDGTMSEWLPVGVLEASRSWSVPGSYGVWAEARCALHTSVVSSAATPLMVRVTPGIGEYLTEPALPVGSGTGETGFLYSFDAGSSFSSADDPVQYRFQWGDGTTSEWVTADEDNLVRGWKFWPAAGSYSVTTEARCALHPELTIPSASVEVQIFRGDPEIFFETFADASHVGESRWQVLSGGWVMNPDETFATDSRQPDNIALVGTIPEFTAGRLTTRLKLAGNSTNPYAGIIFAYTDAEHYRYVALTDSNLYLGQAGETAAESDGIKANVQGTVELDTWHQLRVDVHPDGEVRVYFGESELPALTFRFADSIGGWVGCSANTSEVLFDDFGIWDERVLQP